MMARAEDFFKPEIAARIEAAVKSAEAKTSGEIMTVIAPQSHPYTFTIWLCAIVGAVLASVGAWIYSLQHPWLSLEIVFLLQALGAFAGATVGTLKPAQRILVSRSRMGIAVDEAAMAAFVKNGLTNTKDRTGILIYVSALEHRVEILGDRGIHEKVGKNFWQDEADCFAARMGKGEGVDGLLDLIQDMGQQLGQHFPRKHDDVDELANQPVRR